MNSLTSLTVPARQDKQGMGNWQKTNRDPTNPVNKFQTLGPNTRHSAQAKLIIKTVTFALLLK